MNSKLKVTKLLVTVCASAKQNNIISGFYKLILDRMATTLSIKPKRDDAFYIGALRSLDANVDTIIFPRSSDFVVPKEIADNASYGSVLYNDYLRGITKADSKKAVSEITALALDDDKRLSGKALGALFAMVNSEAGSIAQIGLEGFKTVMLDSKNGTREAAIGKLRDVVMMDYKKWFNSDISYSDLVEEFEAKDKKLNKWNRKEFEECIKIQKEKEQQVIRDLEETRTRVGEFLMGMIKEGDSCLSKEEKELNERIWEIVEGALNCESAEKIGESMIGMALDSGKPTIMQRAEQINSKFKIRNGNSGHK